MEQHGYLGELKEIKSLSPLLTQTALLHQCTLRLLQPDGTAICEAWPGDGGCIIDEVHEQQWREIVHLYLDEATPESCQLREIHCLCGKPFLILPICWKDRTEDFLTVCQATTEQRPFFASLVCMIADRLACIRDGVREWERRSHVVSALDEFYLQTQHLESTHNLYQASLEILLLHFDADIGIFVPRHGDDQWGKPFKVGAVENPMHWFDNLAAYVTTIYSPSQGPGLVTLQTRADDPQFVQFGLSSLIYTKVCLEETSLGLLVLGSLSGEHMLSFDDLPLLESLKRIISMRLRDSRAQQDRETLLTLRTQSELMRRIIRDIKSPAYAAQIFLKHLIGKYNNISSISPDVLELSEKVREQIDSMATLADGMQRFSRPLDVRQEFININELAHRIIDINITLPGLSVSFELCESDPVSAVDVTEISEALTVLMANALKPMKHEGQLHEGQLKVKTQVTAPQQHPQLTGKLDAEFVLIALSDNGCGVPEAVQRDIFQAGVSSNGGAGLGLYTVRMIAEEHGGAAWLAQTGSGGSTFVFAIPLCQYSSERGRNGQALGPTSGR